jgi:hypothetical protein
MECVAEIWNKPGRGNNAVQRWNKKMSALRRYLRGWSKHKFRIYKKTRHSLQQARKVAARYRRWPFLRRRVVLCHC